jgi:hypothetical protein
MELVIWGFGGLLAVVAAIIGIALWRVLWRDRGLPNEGLRKESPARQHARRTIPRGVPKSR